MALQLTEGPSISRALTTRASQPHGGESERQLLVCTASCLYCSKQFYCVHAIRGRTIARRRDRYAARRQKRLRTARRRVPRSVSARARSNRPPRVPRESASVPVQLAPMFSPSARGIGFERVWQFWNNLMQRFQTQFAERQLDNIPTPEPEAEVADTSDEHTENLDLELRLGMPGEDDGVDVTLKL